MADQHPITPPPELVKKWLNEGHHQDYCSASEHAIAQAYTAGADQELEALLVRLRCRGLDNLASDILAARRPKPPSLKEQALHELADVYDRDKIDDSTYDTIRRALEALPND
jgi:hypothetical protein